MRLSLHEAGSGAGAAGGKLPDKRNSGGDEPTLTLRILATSDLHMQILAHDYYGGTAGTGLETLAGLIATLRAGVPNTLLFDNGDLLQGNPLADHLADHPAKGRARAHPAIAALNHLAYDAATLGNHDFTYGTAFLARCIAAARYPVVLANARLPGLRGVAPWTLLHRRLVTASGAAHDLAIGVIGFVPPQTAAWEGHAVPGLRTEDVIACASREVPRLRSAGAQVVVALCHGGIAPLPHQPGAENAAAALAALPGVDAVIAGHTHARIPLDGASDHRPGGPAAVVMPGFGGSHLGLIDLTLTRGPQGWAVTAARAELRRPTQTDAPEAPPPGDPEAAAIRRLALPAHGAALRAAARRVGHSEVALGSQLAMLGLDAGLRLVAMAQRWHMRRALAGTAHAGLPVLVAVSPFRAGGRGGPGHFTRIAPGRLTRGDLARLYSFGNCSTAVLVTGATLADWLERAAGAFRTLVPDRPDQPLLDPDFPGYNFDSIDGLTWQIDLSRPPLSPPCGGPGGAAGSGRVSDIRHTGRPIDPEARFVLATNDYRISGVGLYAPLTTGLPVIHRSTVRLRDIIAAYLRRSRRVRPAAQAPFRFRRLPGATAILQTAPSAAELVATTPLPLEVAGMGMDGFLHLRLDLDP